MSHLSALFKSELIVYHQPTISALHEFEELLNQTHPRTLDEQKMSYTIHELFKADPDAFYAMILKAPESVQYVILYTDTLYITRYFGLLYIAHIKLTKYGFRVTPYHKKTQISHIELPSLSRLSRLSSLSRLSRLSRNASEFKPAGWSAPDDKQTSQTSLRILKRNLSIDKLNTINTQNLAINE